MFFPILAFVKHVTPKGRGIFWAQEDNLNRHGSSPLGDATY